MNKLLVYMIILLILRNKFKKSTDEFVEGSCRFSSLHQSWGDLDDTKIYCNNYNTGEENELCHHTSITYITENGDEWASLPCGKSENLSTTCVMWKKNGKNVQKYCIQKDLSLRVFVDHYFGSVEYMCTACSNTTCTCSTIIFEVDLKKNTNQLLNSTVFIGESKKFICPFKKPFQAKFYKHHIKSIEGIKLLKSEKSYSSEREEMLIIENVTIINKGWYTCVIYDSDGDVELYKSVYLDVIEPNSNTEIIAIASNVSVVIFLLLILIGILYRQKKLNKKCYDWVKIVTVSKHQSENGSNGIQVPIVHIEKKRSLVAINEKNEPLPVLEYEFPIDWEWEFSRQNLVLGKTLGEGAFGKVVLADAHGLAKGGRNMLVAVKMLKDGHTEYDVKDFVCELEIMKMVGKHPYIVNLIGCCSKDGPLYVIVEYALHGNLRDFLLNHRLETDKTHLEKQVLTHHKLISFATQIACGMEHLSSIKCVHRDLAARNVLVSEGLVMKIADFGLARDVHNQDYYRKKTVRKLPIRWMAPESLENLLFDTKSDVWSFGVLLWEIMTLGRMPYSSVAVSENLLEYLKLGHRLEKPSQCPDDVYLIMKECWQFQATERPTFGEIRAKIDICGGNCYL